jgi:hypothetical protein
MHLSLFNKSVGMGVISNVLVVGQTNQNNLTLATLRWEGQQHAQHVGLHIPGLT